jgi:predicted nuclease of restriction endonuclease-like (RecB) superfamily
MKTIKQTDLYSEIKIILQQARQAAYRTVNFTMVLAYWQMGKLIVEYERKEKTKTGYGDYLINDLSKKLTKEFGQGFGATNLKYFRQFYLVFPFKPIGHAVRDQSIKKLPAQKGHALRDQSAKLKANDIVPLISDVLRPELSWTHYRLLIKIDNIDARTWYMKEAAESNWSTRTLERQINTFTYERILSSKNKKGVKKEADQNIEKASPLDFIKDPYVLEFLQLPANSDFYEKDIEEAIISKLQHFILELGKGFSFVARQKRISAEDEHFYIDLVFYNYILKCFVLIDLKLGKLTHQDIGQMDLYTRWWEDNEKTETDNPTIGIILCSQKNEIVVKYSVLKGSKQLFASKYKLYLPTEEEFQHEVHEEIIKYNQYHSK